MSKYNNRMSAEGIKEFVNKNKKLLLQELSESKELVQLLRKSLHTVLTNEEKEKVKQQIYDILKSIPAFGVFMLPGGAILLPILIKYIPTILPSAYRDNEDVKEQE